MTVAVCLHAVGMIWSANAQGDILTACFFTTDEETEDELQRMGYQCLLTASPVAHLAAGTESELTDLGEGFLEACMRRGQGRQDDQRILTRASVRERR